MSNYAQDDTMIYFQNTVDAIGQKLSKIKHPLMELKNSVRWLISWDQLKCAVFEIHPHDQAQMYENLRRVHFDPQYVFLPYGLAIDLSDDWRDWEEYPCLIESLAMTNTPPNSENYDCSFCWERNEQIYRALCLGELSDPSIFERHIKRLKTTVWVCVDSLLLPVLNKIIIAYIC